MCRWMQTCMIVVAEVAVVTQGCDGVPSIRGHALTFSRKKVKQYQQRCLLEIILRSFWACAPGEIRFEVGGSWGDLTYNIHTNLGGDVLMLMGSVCLVLRL